MESKGNMRRDYMAKRITHAEFYRSVNSAAGLKFTKSSMGIRLSEVRAALAAGDRHLNTIPLSRWDAAALVVEPALRRALKAHGDAYSMGGGVCCLKQAALDAAEA